MFNEVFIEVLMLLAEVVAGKGVSAKKMQLTQNSGNLINIYTSVTALLSVYFSLQTSTDEFLEN